MRPRGLKCNWLFLFGSLLLAGCAGGLRGAASPPPQDATGDDLTRRMGALTDGLAVAGFLPTGWERSGELEAGSVARARWRPEEPGRYALLAIGAPQAMDLDLAVHDEQGAVLSEDRTVDRRVALEIVVAEPRSRSIELSAKDVGGRYLLRVFRAPLGSEALALHGLFDNDPIARERWQQVEQRVAQLGYPSAREPRLLTLARGERVALPLSLEAGRCYLLVALGSPGIDSISFRLSQNGTLHAADLSRRSHGWIEHCAEISGEAQLSVTVRAGSGRLRLGNYSAPRAELESRVGPPIRARDDAPTVEVLTRGIEARMTRAGYLPGVTVAERELTAGDRIGSSVRLDGDECMMITAIAGSGLSDVDLELRDADGEIVGSDRSPGPVARVQRCSSGDREYRVELVALAGAGPVRVRLNRLERVQLPGHDGRVSLALREGAALFAGLGLTATDQDPEFTRDEAIAWSTTLNLKAERCYGIAVALRAQPVERLELTDERETLIGWWKGPSAPGTLAICPAHSAEYRLRVFAPGQSETAPRVVVFAGDTDGVDPFLAD